MIDTDFEQLNKKDMAAHCPPIYTIEPDRLAYLEKRDKVLTELEAWLKARLEHENKTMNETEDVEMRVAVGHAGLAFFDVIQQIEKLSQ